MKENEIIDILMLSDTHGQVLPHIEKCVVLILNGDYTSKRYDKYASMFWDYDRLLRSIKSQADEYWLENKEPITREIFINNGNHETLIAAEIIHARNSHYRSLLKYKIIDFINYMKMTYDIKVHVAMSLTSGFAEQKIIESKYLGKVFMTPFTEEINTPEVWGNNWTIARENQAREMTKDGVDVIISHSPPLGIADGSVLTSGDYKDRMGDEIMLEILNTSDPVLYVSGHIHGAHGDYQVNNTTIHSVAHVNEHYVSTNNFKRTTYERR